MAVILPNVIQYPISVFAALKCGMQVVNINPLYTSHEILGVLRDSGARIVVCLESITSEVLKIHDQTYLDYIISCSVGDCLSPMKRAFVNFYLRHFTNMVPKYDKDKVIMFNNCLKEAAGRDFDKVEIDLMILHSYSTQVVQQVSQKAQC